MTSKKKCRKSEIFRNRRAKPKRIRGVRVGGVGGEWGVFFVFVFTGFWVWGLVGFCKTAGGVWFGGASNDEFLNASC